MFDLILDLVEDFHTVEVRRLHRIFCGLITRIDYSADAAFRAASVFSYRTNLAFGQKQNSTFLPLKSYHQNSKSRLRSHKIRFQPHQILQQLGLFTIVKYRCWLSRIRCQFPATTTKGLSNCSSICSAACFLWDFLDCFLSPFFPTIRFEIAACVLSFLK